MASIPFNQDFRPGSIKTSNRYNYGFKPIQLLLQSLLIKASDPDHFGLQTRINHDLNQFQSRLLSRINKDFRPGLIKTSDPDQSRLQTDQLWLQSFLIKTSDPDKSRLLTRINHDFKPIQLWLQSL
jgi:hypothetical protein